MVEKSRKMNHRVEIHGLKKCYVVRRLVPQLLPDSLHLLDCACQAPSVHGDSSKGKTIRVGCHAPSLRIFPTQAPNPGLPHFSGFLPPEPPQGKPKNTEWVAVSFPGDLLIPRIGTGVSYIVGRFFTS